jgi:hypothetical protein
MNNHDQMVRCKQYLKSTALPGVCVYTAHSHSRGQPYQQVWQYDNIPLMCTKNMLFANDKAITYSSFPLPTQRQSTAPGEFHAIWTDPRHRWKSPLSSMGTTEKLQI